jgi:mono/diheme cytochrome c family protein
MRILIAGLFGLVPVTPAAMAQAPADEGERIYTTICQGCHMSKGEGATGAGTYPKLAGNPLVASRQYVAMMVLMGRKGMPSFGTTPGLSAQQARMLAGLTDEQIAAVVNYVRTHFGNDFKDPATAKEVAELPHPGGKGSGRAG